MGDLGFWTPNNRHNTRTFDDQSPWIFFFDVKGNLSSLEL